MIRFDHRNFDVQGTERVFRKVVQPNQNGMRMVDKDGVPLRGPNTQALTRLHSNYVLSPRGVPTRKSNHAYSGQLAQAKMQNLVNSLDTNTAEMTSYASMHSYTNGLSSAGSSRHYIPVNVMPKKRAFGSGPARSIKSVMAKSASSQRSTRYLSSAPSQENIHPDLIDVEKTNHSPQGQRLEKEWSAMSQCRALKRSSEIVSHRVDRMYFMTGNKLKLQAKYNIEEDELQNLRELSQARAVSRSTRSGQRKKGDVYRPDKSAGTSKGVDNDQKSEADTLEAKDPKVIVSQKILTPKPQSVCKSPIEGWTGENGSEKGSTGGDGITNNNLLHNGDKAEELKEAEQIKTAETAGEDGEEKEQKEVTAAAETDVNGDIDAAGGNSGDGDDTLTNMEKEKDVKDVEENKSVHNTESDKDRTEVRGEDYIDKESVEDAGRHDNK